MKVKKNWKRRNKTGKLDSIDFYADQELGVIVLKSIKNLDALLNKMQTQKSVTPSNIYQYTILYTVHPQAF